MLSLFGGIETGLQALQELNIPIEEYHSFEILPAAIKVTQKNFPFVIHHGDVKEADFSEFIGFDMVIAGSPCQNRSRIRKEDKSIHSGLKGDKSSLFWCFAKALEVIKPTWFMLENVISEMPEDDETITKTVGVQPIMINSNLFSAQDRERLYWTNIPIAPLPTECNIVLGDIMEINVAEKYYYNKPFEFHGDDKKIIATLQVNSTDMCKRVYNRIFIGFFNSANGLTAWFARLTFGKFLKKILFGYVFSSKPLKICLITSFVQPFPQRLHLAV